MSDIWGEWRFEPWKDGSAEGLYRRTTAVKASFVGDVFGYYSDDYIVWKYLPEDAERLRQGAGAEEGLIVQRYIFLQADGDPAFQKNSFLFGFRGSVEVYRYTLGDEPPDEIADVAGLCNAARRRLRQTDAA